MFLLSGKLFSNIHPVHQKWDDDGGDERGIVGLADRVGEADDALERLQEFRSSE